MVHEEPRSGSGAQSVTPKAHWRLHERLECGSKLRRLRSVNEAPFGGMMEHLTTIERW
jgi:hypothetical protein